MYTAVIVAPYCKSEVTLTALQLADWLQLLGLNVYFVSSTRVTTGMHEHWDNNVISHNNYAQVALVLNKASHVCWFAHCHAAERNLDLRKKQIKRTVKQLFFPGWVPYMDYQYATSLFTQRVVCLSQAFYNWLDVRYKDIDKTQSLLATPDKLLIPRSGPISSHWMKLLVYVPKSIEQDVPNSYFQLFHTLFKQYSVQVGFVFEKPLNSTYRRVFNRLSRQYSEQVRLERVVNLSDYKWLSHQYDMVYLLNARHTHGALFSLFSGFNLPVVCNMMPLALEHVANNVGCIVATELVEKPIPVAKINAETFLSNMGYIGRNYTNWLINVQGKQFAALQHSQFLFEQFLRQEFQL